MHQPKKGTLGGGLLLVAAIFLGRETIIWVWGKLLDAVVGAEGKSPVIAATFPWLDAAGLALGITGAAFIWWSRPHWTKKSALTLAFDGELQTASPTRQEWVRWFYWYHFPGVAVDFEAKRTAAVPGYVMVFIALDFPAFTNHSRVRVLGGGIHCELVSAHPSGAIVRAIGDMRGRTLEVRFSSEPIPLD